MRPNGDIIRHGDYWMSCKAASGFVSIRRGVMHSATKEFKKYIGKAGTTLIHALFKEGEFEMRKVR